MLNFIEGMVTVFVILGRLIKYILFDLWMQLFSRIFICQLKGHDWRFIGGGWIFTSKYPLQCKRCGKCTKDWDSI